MVCKFNHIESISWRLWFGFSLMFFGGGGGRGIMLRLIIIDFSYTIFYWIHNKQSVNNTPPPPQRWLFDSVFYILTIYKCWIAGHQITMTKNYSKLLRNFQWYCDEGNVHCVAFEVLSMTECLFTMWMFKWNSTKSASGDSHKRIIRNLAH